MKSWLRSLLVLCALAMGFCSQASAAVYQDRWCVTNTIYYNDYNQCFPTSAEMTQNFWAYMEPKLRGTVTVDRTYVQVTWSVLEGCATIGTNPPVVRCTTSNHGQEFSTDGTLLLTFTPSEGYFQMVMGCGEVLGTTYVVGTSGGCAQTAPSQKPVCMTCPVGNPITPLDGIKRQQEVVMSWGRGHSFKATYNYLQESVGQHFNRLGQPSLGKLWFSNHHKAGTSSYSQTGDLQIYQREDGNWKSFYAYASAAYSLVEEDPQPKNSGSGYWYYDTAAEAIETFVTAVGRRRYATSVAYIDGRRLSYTLGNVAFGNGATTPALQTITDDSGRQVSFTYEEDPAVEASVRIATMVDPAGGIYKFGYGAAGQLVSIQYPDLTTRQYKYEVDGKPWLITSLTDENGDLYGRYAYDSSGRANSTKTGTNGAQWSLEWSQAPQLSVTETYVSGTLYRSMAFSQPAVAQLHGPDGYEETMSSTQVDGATLLGSRVLPAGSGSGGSTLQFDRDSEGNPTRSIDANGLQTCRAFVSGRHAESSRVEGLANGTTCGTVLAANAALPTGARKVSSLWHPVWRKQVRIAEPNRITTLVYNGQPDPTNGNAVASCAPSTAVLPDSSKIVVLCKRVEQATTDATGALAFNAVSQAGVPARTSSWTYDAQGHVLTETDPLGKTTTNEYYADTTADHWIGDLKSSTNAAGHVTNYLRYNALGQLLEMVDPNGISMVYTYDVRSRVTSVTQGEQTTGYTYWPTGLVKQITQPDGSTVAYEYDDAHRLTAVADNLGNRIQYTLDQRGNRTNEAVKDPNGTLQRSLGRVFDALSRTQQTTGGE